MQPFQWKSAAIDGVFEMGMQSISSVNPVSGSEIASVASIEQDTPSIIPSSSPAPRNIRNVIVRLGRELQGTMQATKRAERASAALDQLEVKLAQFLQATDGRRNTVNDFKAANEVIKGAIVDDELLLDGTFIIEAGNDRFVLESVGNGVIEPHDADAAIERLADEVTAARRGLDVFRSEQLDAHMSEISVRLGILHAANAGANAPDAEQAQRINDAVRTVLDRLGSSIGSLIDTLG